MRPQQPEGFTGTYLERHVIDREPVAETFLEVSDGEQVTPSDRHPAVANTRYNETHDYSISQDAHRWAFLDQSHRRAHAREPILRSYAGIFVRGQRKRVGFGAGLRRP